jgi:protocatechuate 3,4-dioxygenase beta subunit
VELTDEVVAAFANAPDARARELAQAAVRHLHAFAAEVGLTRAEWKAGIDFLTAIGQITTETRQEFILLSDTLGLSSLVETLIASSGTEHTVLGPFYVPGSPRRELGSSILVDDDPGERVELAGRVRSADGTPLRATLDVWQNASNRLYAVQDPGQSPENLRGIFETGGDGAFSFTTVRPVPYQIPHDGPVGAMLAATARHPWRPAHIHFLVTAPGFVPLTTHVFDAASEYLDSDAVFGVRDGLVASFDGGRATFDFVLVGLSASRTVSGAMKISDPLAVARERRRVLGAGEPEASLVCGSPRSSGLSP